MIFIVESKRDFLIWKKAISSYVVQSLPPSELYDIADQLGRGSHARVFLA